MRAFIDGNAAQLHPAVASSGTNVGLSSGVPLFRTPCWRGSEPVNRDEWLGLVSGIGATMFVQTTARRARRSKAGDVPAG